MYVYGVLLNYYYIVVVHLSFKYFVILLFISCRLSTTDMISIGLKIFIYQRFKTIKVVHNIINYLCYGYGKKIEYNYVVTSF